MLPAIDAGKRWGGTGRGRCRTGPAVAGGGRGGRRAMAEASGPPGASAFDAAAYGRSAAGNYGALHSGLDPGPAVQILADLAAGLPVVEFGTGTGRIALPLAERGLEVHGIDGSPEMAAQLRRKPGGDKITGHRGQFRRGAGGHGIRPRCAGRQYGVRAAVAGRPGGVLPQCRASPAARRPFCRRYQHTSCSGLGESARRTLVSSSDRPVPGRGRSSQE
jgi:Methyltransferase domain